MTTESYNAMSLLRLTGLRITIYHCNQLYKYTAQWSLYLGIGVVHYLPLLSLLEAFHWTMFVCVVGVEAVIVYCNT